MHVTKSFPYNEFIRRVRKFSSDDLIRTLGHVPRNYLDAEADRNLWQQISPWAIAAIARESFIFSNPHRGSRVPSLNDVHLLSNAYANTYEKSKEIGDLFVAQFMGRTSLEQFPHQESDYEELMRFLSIYRDSKGIYADKIRRAFEISLGLTASDFANSAILAYALAESSKGLIKQNIFDEAFGINSEINIDFQIFNKFLDRISADQGVFREISSTFEKPKLSDGFKYRPNALNFTPILKLKSQELVAPLPRYILRRSSHSIVFHDCKDFGGEEYASAVGQVFEQYLGEQLSLLTNCKIHRSIDWTEGGQSFQSIDWIVETNSCVVLIESKASRIPISSSLGEAALFESVEKILTKASIQIDKTFSQFISSNPKFSNIRSDLPFVGIVASAESLRIGNNPYVRRNIHAKLPFLSMSFREIENSLPMDGSKWARELLDISRDKEKSTWNVLSAMSTSFTPIRNPLHDRAAELLGIFNHLGLDGDD